MYYKKCFYNTFCNVIFRTMYSFETKNVWYIREYRQWRSSGCPIVLTVVAIDITDSNITSIPPEIENLKNLEALYLSNNNLTSLPVEFGNLQNLRELHLTRNKLTYLPVSFGNLQKLQVLHLTHNNITVFPQDLLYLENIRVLFLSYNNISTIPAEIENLKTLRTFYITNNRLAYIPPELGNITNLENLAVSYNALTYLPYEIGNLRHLSHLYVSNNPIDYIPPNIERIINGKAQGIYEDTQSVHNSTVQQSIKSSILRLISTKPAIDSKEIITSIFDDHILSDFTKRSLSEYSQNTDLISDVNVTFLDVLTAVWNRILPSEHSTAIKNVLNIEMADAECKCFTGRVSRLVNCLSGFDKDVEVKIADNEQIGNVITTVENDLKSRNTYTIELHKIIARERLTELGYTKEVVEEWIGYIE